MTPDASSPLQGGGPEVEGHRRTRSQPSPTAIPQPSPSLSGPPNSTAGSSHRRSLHAGDPGPQSFTQTQSPLRKSVLYDRQEPQPQLKTRPSFQRVVDFADGQSGRAAMSYTGDRRSRPRQSHAGPAHEEQQAAAVATPSATPTPKSAVVTPQSVASGGSSRFAVFASTMFKGMAATPASSSANPVSVPQDDDLMNLDIDAAIYPAGSEGDAFSPAAYKNLQQRASGLLNRFQTAYQQRTIAYHEIKAERGAQADEKEGSDMRMHHLRMQLEDMARKASEQEAIMRSLVDDLARERKLRIDERRQLSPCKQGSTSLSEGSVSEDLGVDEDQRRREWQRRRSGGTERSDAGFDTDEDSVEEASLFSRSRSPTVGTTLTEPSPVDTPVPQIRTSATISRTPRPPQPSATTQQHQQRAPQMNTLQKLFKGMSGDPSKAAVSTCSNCEGQDASVAWDTVNLLKGENKGLKGRVSELEAAVEGALDAATGVALYEPASMAQQSTQPR